MKNERFALHRLLLFGLAFAVIWITHRFDFVGLRGFVQGDLGLILNVPRRILQGEVPYRDFYAGNYTPGSYYFHAALFWLFGQRASVLAGAQAFSQMAALVLTYLLARRVASEQAALLLTILALWVAIPPVNIAFPAIYCVALGLACLECLLRFLEHRRRRYLISCGIALGLALACKISTGSFILAALIWTTLAATGAIRWLRAFSLALCVAGLVLIRQRLNVATLLVFEVPLILLTVLSFRLDRARGAKKINAQDVAAFTFPFASVTLLWVVPFLKLLGAQGFLFHFFQFPAAQAQVLYVGPPLPVFDSGATWVSALGFTTMNDWKSLWKLWFYLPLAVSLGLLPIVERRPKLLGFYAYHALLTLQIFPQLDQLHLKWSVSGAILLCAAIDHRSRVAKRYALATGMVLVTLSLAVWGGFLAARQTQGGYHKLAPNRLNLYYPAAHAQAFEAVARFLEENLKADETFWNPPGALFNFVLDLPYPLPTDYLGPRYLTDRQVDDLLNRVDQSPPRFVIIPDLPETEFGWESLERNYPTIRNYIDERYEFIKQVGPYRVTELISR